MSSTTRPVAVVSAIAPQQIRTNAAGLPEISSEDQANDALDDFNHPRFRRALILKALEELDADTVSFCVPSVPAANLDDYLAIHSQGLIEFLSSAWNTWDALGEEGRDPCGAMPTATATPARSSIPALIPTNAPLGRVPHQRPSKHVIGQMGYYCTDNCTPIFSALLDELYMDAAIVETAVSKAFETICCGGGVSYALPTHPGHHCAKDSFGGYCYLNHAARTARLLQSKLGDEANHVAILDVDYHCGNGTASIFYKDPSVLVVSIHCDPDWDYPFHSGFSDETGAEEGVGATLHLPLSPGTMWSGSNGYLEALETAMGRIVENFRAKALVVSLGLDTHDGDPCTIRRAGFCLAGQDYWNMGRVIGSKVESLPTVFVQEGGYRMDSVGTAAPNVLAGFCSV